MAVGDSSRVQEAQQLVKSDPRKAEALYKDLISKAPTTGADAATRQYEAALLGLGELYRDEQCVPPRASTPRSPFRLVWFTCSLTMSQQDARACRSGEAKPHGVVIVCQSQVIKAG
jgi:hypothetical protein